MHEPSSIQTFDEGRAAGYDERIRRVAPGYELLHEEVVAVLSTTLPREARILVVGAGTGTEIVEMSRVSSDWRFTAVDPSSEMLGRCRERIREAGIEDRVNYVDQPIEKYSCPVGFDAATSIFVAHFIEDVAAKRAYFEAISRRLRSDGTMIVADLFDSGSEVGFDRLMDAWRSSVEHAGLSPGAVDRAFDRIRQQISFLEESRLQQLLGIAGFQETVRFFQSFLWGAWQTRKK